MICTIIFTYTLVFKDREENKVKALDKRTAGGMLALMEDIEDNRSMVGDDFIGIKNILIKGYAPFDCSKEPKQ